LHWYYRFELKKEKERRKEKSFLYRSRYGVSKSFWHFPADIIEKTNVTLCIVSVLCRCARIYKKDITKRKGICILR
jgi:hypothetical protein